MMRARPTALLVAVATAVLGIATLVPTASAAPPPGVWVSPSTALAGGSVVRVIAHGVTPGASVDVTQCDAYVGDPDYDCQPTATVTAGPAGGVSLLLTLADPVFRAEPEGSATPVYCRADTCRVFLSWTDEDGTPQVLSSRRLVFRGAPATISVAPSTGLVDGQRVRVTGTAVGAAGRTVQVVEQGCFDIVQATGCYGALQTRTTTVRPGGGFSLDYVVHRVLGDGQSDCTEPDILGECVISAVVLDAQGQPDDTYGGASRGTPAAYLSFAAVG